MIPVLIGDIGGTNSRLKLIEIDSKKDILETEEIDKYIYSTYKYSSLETIILEFLEKYKGTDKYPKLGVIGVPCMVLNNRLMNFLYFPSLSNKTGEEVALNVGIERIIFLNDFEINGYSIQSKNFKEGVDYINITPEINSMENKTKALIGPGTGLGVGFLTKSPLEKYYSVFPSSGGLFPFAPNNKLQKKLRKYLIEVYKSYNITNPDIALLCRGPTIIQICKFLNKEEKIEGNKEIMDILKDLIKDENEDKLNALNKKIVKFGIEGNCPLCRKTIDFYIEIFGYVCANVALTFLPFGGFYLTGGVVSAIANYIKESKIFMDNFTYKNKNELKKIPIYVMINTDIGLEGATIYAKKFIEENKI